MNWLRGFTGCFIFLIGIFTLAFFLHSVKGEFFGLVVQDAEISPAVAKIGELVNIDVTIKNVGRNATRCNVTAFCGDCVVEGIQEVTIASQTSVPLFFELNTSYLSTGVYSIEILVEEKSGQQKIFDCGIITIEQDDLTTADVTDPGPSSTSPAYSNLPYLLPVVSAGATASILILRKRRNKSQEPAIPKGQLPHMLNEILKFEKKVETEIPDDKKYIW